MKYQRLHALLLGLGTLLVLTACSHGIELAVDLQTDLVAGVEFDTVQVVLDGAVADPMRADTADDFRAGQRVFEAGSMVAGPHELWVTVLQGSTIVVSRRFALELDSSLIFTAILARDCRGVTCPGATDAATASECFGGRCVAPACTTLGDPSCLGTECRFDADCASATSCIAPICSRGICLEVAARGGCPPGEYCQPGAGCQPHGGAPDAGPTPDAGPGDAGPCTGAENCDDGITCTIDSCEMGRCIHNADDSACTTGISPTCDPSAADANPVTGCVSEACDATNCTGGPCMDAACVDGICSRTERCAMDELCCDGVCAAACEEVPCAGQPAGTVCRPAAGPCDVAETCSGMSATCPPDGFTASEFICRPSGGPCDTPETCTGTSASCPTDRFSVGRFPCRPAAGPCDAPESCDGRSAACPLDARRPASYECRPSVGPCDLAETCGFSVSTACPSDRVVSAGTICRPGSVCDPQEVCTGLSGTCPSDVVSPNGSACDVFCGRETCFRGICSGGVSCAPPDVCICDACSRVGTACD